MRALSHSQIDRDLPRVKGRFSVYRERRGEYVHAFLAEIPRPYIKSRSWFAHSLTCVCIYRHAGSSWFPGAERALFVGLDQGERGRQPQEGASQSQEREVFGLVNAGAGIKEV